MDARIADLTEKAKGSGKGSDDAQAKLDAMAADYEGKLTGANERISKMMKRGATSEFEAELSRAGFKPSVTAKMAQFNMDRISFNEDGTTKVMTSDGKPMIGSGSDHGATFADLAKEMAASPDNVDFVLSSFKGGGGKPAGSQGGTPDKVNVTRATFEGMSQSERSDHSKSGGGISG